MYTMLNMIIGKAMYIIVIEILLACIALVGYYFLRRVLRLSQAGERLAWFESLWVPLVSLLFFTWLYSALKILPWAYYLQELVLFFDLSASKNVTTLSDQFVETYQYYSYLFFILGYSFIFGWLCISLIKKWESGFYQKSSAYNSDFQAAIEVLFMVLRAVVYLTLAFVIMRVFNLDHLANSLFATGAVGALFVSFAARDSIANIFGGFMILLDRPFRVGDYISSPDRNIEGTVERIGWRVTQVRTPQKRPKYIPNCLFSTVSIENISRMSNRNIRFTLTVRYEDLPKVKAICQKLEKAYEQCDFLDKRMSNFCTFNSLGDFSVNILLNLYTKPLVFREYNKVIESVLHIAVDVVQSSGAGFPFPTTTLDSDQIVAYLKALQQKDLPSRD